MANFWLLEKQYVHKLFKVLVPRYENWNLSYTRMYKAPRIYAAPRYQYLDRTILELRGNPYPQLTQDFKENRNFINNVLLDEAKRAYRKEKYAEIAAKLIPSSNAATTTKDITDNTQENITIANESSDNTVEDKNK